MKLDVVDRKRTIRRSARRRPPARAQALAEEPGHQLLDLQRQLGNGAVTRLIQRTPKDRPQSTDAPWVSKRRPKPKPAKKLSDISARVIKGDIDAGKTRITIGSGPEQGVQVGMTGALVSTKGRELASFVIDSATERISRAYIDTILDEVRRNPQVVIHASKFVTMEGKEF
jgi:hypothetical protein